MDLTEFIEELGIDTMSPEEQKQIFESVMKNLSIRVIRRLAENMTDEEGAELTQLMQQGGNEAVMAELERRYPNMPQIYEEELAALKENVKATLAQ